MSSFGFGKPAEKREKTIDKAGLPRGPIVVDPASERDAVARGDRGEERSKRLGERMTVEFDRGFQEARGAGRDCRCGPTGVLTSWG